MRPILQSDIPFIIKCLQELRLESPTYSVCADDPKYVTEKLTELIEADSFYGVIEDDKGFLIGCISQAWYSDVPIAYEQLLYVTPEHRGLSVALALIHAFVSASFARDVDEVRAGASTGLSDELVLRLYVRAGFERYGVGVRKRK